MIRLFLILVVASLSSGEVSKPTINGRIIGGQDADIADYPYQLGLIADSLLFCGAALISPTWAITAAHCTDGLEFAEINILANTSFASSGVIVNISRVIQNDDFDYGTADSDISLLELAFPLTCTNCKPIALSATQPETNETATITGWGVTHEDDLDGSDVLQFVDVPVVNEQACSDIFKSRNQDFTDNMFCAGDMMSKDSCLGDSGGPAVIGGKLAGIVSWGIGCAEPGLPGVYTNVPNFLEWIKENTGIVAE